MSPTVSVAVKAAVWRGIREHHRLQTSLAPVRDLEVLFPEVTHARVDGTITVAAPFVYRIIGIGIVLDSEMFPFFFVLEGNNFSRAIRDHRPPAITFTRLVAS
jgi:hypothetical protein